jgi:hypothetical protein
MKTKGNYTNLELNKAGNLIITLTRQGKKFAKELLEQDSDADCKLQDLLEEHLTNGWEWILPEEIGALTEAPIISNDVIYDNEECEVAGVNKCYAYVDYMIYDPIEELIKHNSVVFMEAGNL